MGSNQTRADEIESDKQTWSWCQFRSPSFMDSQFGSSEDQLAPVTPPHRTSMLPLPEPLSMSTFNQRFLALQMRRMQQLLGSTLEEPEANSPEPEVGSFHFLTIGP
eukprot:GHVO01002467.1.p1 GENE.GHVO01002467.1~~GHVO01002467.1.p1  ORF type:complete len:123 (+),score=8.19 GHVO01002467.1:53-370(+)